MPVADRTAYEAAVMLLARRLSSRRDLARRLAMKKRWEPGEIDDALNRLERQGFLNDRAYAEDIVHSLRVRGCGPALIRRTLRTKGVPEELASLVMQAAADEPNSPGELQRALDALKRKRAQIAREPDPRKRKAKALRFLVGRGFDYETSFAAANRICGDSAEEEDAW